MDNRRHTTRSVAWPWLASEGTPFSSLSSCGKPGQILIANEAGWPNGSLLLKVASFQENFTCHVVVSLELNKSISD